MHGQQNILKKQYNTFIHENRFVLTWTFSPVLKSANPASSTPPPLSLSLSLSLLRAQRKMLHLIFSYEGTATMDPQITQEPSVCEVHYVPLATEPGISLIIPTPMKIMQRNLNRSTFVVWEMKRNVSVVCVCSVCVCSVCL